ncbi:MAG: hypothetical protein ACLFVE_08705 [Chitinispirillaceae bacterium]
MLSKHPSNDRMFIVVVGNDTLIAVPSDSLKAEMKRRVSLDSARAVLVRKDSLIAGLEKAQQSYAKLVEDQRFYIAQSDSLVADYRKLVANYKKSSVKEWVSVEVSAGATTKAYKPALMAGLSVAGRFSTHFFMQEKNPGILVGYSLPLF